MCKIGQVIIARNGKKFMVVKLPNGGNGLLDLHRCKVRDVEDIEDYINLNHFGIDDVLDSLE